MRPSASAASEPRAPLPPARLPLWQPLRARATAPEWMDIAEVDDGDLARCLADLETVNRLTRAAAPTLTFLARLTAAWPEGTELRLLDAGSGAGGMLRAIHRWATARGLRPRLVGVDLNPQAARIARALTPAGMDIRFETADIFTADIASLKPQVVTSALFAHHLDDAAVVRFLAWMERGASHGWFVNDLHRHWVAAHGFRLIATLAGWHRFVRHDGPLSVARAFVADDWQQLLAAAGVTGAEVAWHLPFRLCVARLKPAAPA